MPSGNLWEKEMLTFCSKYCSPVQTLHILEMSQFLGWSEVAFVAGAKGCDGLRAPWTFITVACVGLLVPRVGLLLH